MKLKVLLESKVLALLYFTILAIGHPTIQAVTEKFKRACIESMGANNFNADSNQEFRILQDVLPEICSYLKIQDLCNVKSVCAAFKWAAEHEMKKRRPELRSMTIVSEKNGGEKTLPNLLGIRPRIVLFFTNSNKPAFIYNSVSHELMSHYLPEVPRLCPIIHLMGSMTAIDKKLLDPLDNEAGGIFLHETSNVKIQSSGLSNFGRSRLSDQDLSPRRFFTESFPARWKTCSPFGYIVFNAASINDYFEYEAASGSNNELDIVLEMSKRYSNSAKKFAIWGGQVFYMSSTGLNMLYSHSDGIFTDSLGISISGAGVNCWSLIINRSDNNLEKRQKIEKFKAAINIKSSKTIVLSMTTATDQDRNSEAGSMENKLFLKLFLEIPLLTFGIPPSLNKYCVDSWITPPPAEIQRIVHDDDDVICYMIVTYR